MKRTLLIWASMACMTVHSVMAQDAAVNKIIEIGQTDNQVMDHLDVLTNRIGGRVIGSNAYDNAVEWVASKLRNGTGSRTTRGRHAAGRLQPRTVVRQTVGRKRDGTAFRHSLLHRRNKGCTTRTCLTGTAYPKRVRPHERTTKRGLGADQREECRLAGRRPPKATPSVPPSFPKTTKRPKKNRQIMEDNWRNNTDNPAATIERGCPSLVLQTDVRSRRIGFIQSAPSFACPL